MPDTASPQGPDGSRARIRMYRQGLGDCFLLTFYGDHEPRHILIDCGVLSGTPGGKAKIRQVAENIRAETGGKGNLDALVATHEHWDHVSGFYDAKDIFDPMTIGEIWVAWTENPSDPVAQSLKRQNGLKLQAIHQALAQLANTGGPQMRAYGQGVAELLDFYGGPMEAAGLAAFSEKTAAAMAAVTQRSSPEPTYCKPGDVLRPNWLPGINVYVLGPPQEMGMLKNMEGKAGSDTYALTGADSAFSAALEGALAATGQPVDPASAGRINAALPFHPSLQWLEKHQEKILKDPHFGPLYQSYNAKDADWRRIDQDWLLSMARLGLQLDNAINNTSLVLAFEFTGSGQVLLFAADAQIGNWKSWSTIKAFKSDDLLRRTVFYKVGHHGSHNATMKEGGLEAMTTPGLVAAIPVDQDFANNSKHWAMPAPALYDRLKDLTKGRILRVDAAWPGKNEPPPEPLPQDLSDQAWGRFTQAVSLDPGGLFIDYFIR